jgi:hypothetical protein
MKKFKEFYKKYKEWEIEEVFLNFGFFYVETNNISVVIVLMVITSLLLLFKLSNSIF